MTLIENIDELVEGCWYIVNGRTLFKVLTTEGDYVCYRQHNSEKPTFSKFADYGSWERPSKQFLCANRVHDDNEYN